VKETNECVEGYGSVKTVEETLGGFGLSQCLRQSRRETGVILKPKKDVSFYSRVQTIDTHSLINQLFPIREL
jgi:hypothetical protein